MLVRIPVHPIAWRERGAVKYLQTYLIRPLTGVQIWACI